MAGKLRPPGVGQYNRAHAGVPIVSRSVARDILNEGAALCNIG